MLSKFMIFAAGAVIGSAVTWKLVKTKYEQIADEEIASVKEVYSRRRAEEESESKKIKELGKAMTEGFVDGFSHPDKEDVNKYRNYANEYKSSEEKEEDNMPVRSLPYVISPEEFDELGYETVSLTYYADGVLTDDGDNIIEDVDDLIGEESLEHFGEYEEDSVFVRDDEKEIDYEILRDQRNYYDVYPE